MDGMSENHVVQITQGRHAIGRVHNFLFSEKLDYPERIGSIYYPFFIISTYLLIITAVGPLLMKPFKPLKIKWLLIAFNVTIVLWNAHISFNLFKHIYGAVRQGKLCNLRVSQESQKLFDERAFKFVWSFYLSKYVDLLDTFFFVLRKKQRQVSFLHVFHHSSVILIIWVNIKNLSTGNHHCVAIALNSFVHVCTYSYYALSACGPEMQKILNPKKIYLTFVQVVQFWIVLAYMLWSTVTGCEMLDMWSSTVVIFLFILMLLFANFYAKNYAKKKQ